MQETECPILAVVGAHLPAYWITAFVDPQHLYKEWEGSEVRDIALFVLEAMEPRQSRQSKPPWLLSEEAERSRIGSLCCCYYNLHSIDRAMFARKWTMKELNYWHRQSVEMGLNYYDMAGIGNEAEYDDAIIVRCGYGSTLNENEYDLNDVSEHNPVRDLLIFVISGFLIIVEVENGLKLNKNDYFVVVVVVGDSWCYLRCSWKSII